MKKLTAVVLSLIIIMSALAPVYASDSKPDIARITFKTEKGNGISLKKSDGYINAEVKVEDVDGLELSDKVIMKVRGNSTAFDSIGKKSYTFKFEKKKSLYGMGSGKKWALISNVCDPTLARNYVAFSLSKELGIQYASDFKVVEVYLDGSFRGCYLLLEPVTDGKERVDIDTKGNDGKKDFLLELEKLREEDDVTYIKSNGIRFAISEPDPPSEEQTSYIGAVMDDIISTIRTGTKEEIEAKVDIASFARFYVLNEFLKTVDFDFSSVFFYYKDGKLYAGPPWDYDLSTGNVNKDFSANYAESYKTEDLFITNKNLFRFLCDYDWFNDETKKVYSQHSAYFNSIPEKGGVIDTFYNTYKKAIKRNFGDKGWDVKRYYVNVMKYPLNTYEENYDFYVNWCKERVNWLNSYYKINEPTEETTEQTATETAALETKAATEPESTAEPTTSSAYTSEPVETTAQATVQTTAQATTQQITTEVPEPAPTVEPTTEKTATEPMETTAPLEQPTSEPQPTKATEEQPTTAPEHNELPPITITNNLSLNAGQTKIIALPFAADCKSSDGKVAKVKNDVITALKKGTADITANVFGVKVVFKVKVNTSPKLSKKSLTVKKGGVKTIKISGKANSVNNKYKNTKYAKIISGKTAKTLKIRGLKRGKTVLKITVNGVKLKLNVKVK